MKKFLLSCLLGISVSSVSQAGNCSSFIGANIVQPVAVVQQQHFVQQQFVPSFQTFNVAHVAVPVQQVVVRNFQNFHANNFASFRVRNFNRGFNNVVRVRNFNNFQRVRFRSFNRRGFNRGFSFGFARF